MKTKNNNNNQNTPKTEPSAEDKAAWTIVRTYRGTVGRRKVSEEELNEFKQSQEYKDDVADGFQFAFIRNKE